jgi:class I fructose-bisphosphate aldolase
MKHKRLSEEGFGEKGNYTIILPIDQGVEHGPVDAFFATEHPEMLDIDYQVDYIAELLHEGLVGATALPRRTANLLCKKYPHLSKDVILKLNHGNNLNKDLEPSQAVYASSRDAANMGGVGFTIYPGSSNQDDMINYFGKIQDHKPDNVKSILWSYPRSLGYEETRVKTLMHAAYMAAQLEPDVIKVKMPANSRNVTNIVKAACGIPVVFSGGTYTDPHHMIHYAERIAQAGGYGMIVGRNIFQRKPDKAKNLLRDIHKVFRES